MVVNVASECGYTDLNYKELVRLQNDYQHRGFTVLAFPSNQFGQQEPGTNQQIITLATESYAANFPIFGKIDVMGNTTCPVYEYLVGKTGSMPTWNFCKYLVDRRGEVVQYFSQANSFDEIRTSIEYLLGKSYSDEL